MALFLPHYAIFPPLVAKQDRILMVFRGDQVSPFGLVLLQFLIPDVMCFVGISAISFVTYSHP